MDRGLDLCVLAVRWLVGLESSARRIPLAYPNLYHSDYRSTGQRRRLPFQFTRVDTIPTHCQSLVDRGHWTNVWIANVGCLLATDAANLSNSGFKHG